MFDGDNNNERDQNLNDTHTNHEKFVLHSFLVSPFWCTYSQIFFFGEPPSPPLCSKHSFENDAFRRICQEKKIKKWNNDFSTQTEGLDQTGPKCFLPCAQCVSLSCIFVFSFIFFQRAPLFLSVSLTSHKAWSWRSAWRRHHTFFRFSFNWSI